MSKTIEGVVRRHRAGFGFLLVDTGDRDDVYLPPEELEGILDGDRVRITVERRGGRERGRVEEVVARGRERVVGTYHEERGATWVDAEDPALGMLQVRPKDGPPVKPGEIVTARIVSFPKEGRGAWGVIERVLGVAGDPAQKVLGIAYAAGFSDAFPAEVEAEAARLPDSVRLEDLAGRRDLRELPLVTIDGIDARDFDDAVYVERLPGGGFRLVVAIADVAHYVIKGSALDQEARHRGTSVYFPTTVLPMLPEHLSNGLCSLNPGVDRLAMVADLIFDRDARTVNTELYEAVIRSHHRLTYAEVGAWIAGEEEATGHEAQAWREHHLPPALELARALSGRRKVRGALDLDLPEPEIVLGRGNRPRQIVRRTRTWAHRLVEEFMLAANEAVAWFFASRGLPTIYRVHDDPDEAKLSAFAEVARAHGLKIDPKTQDDAASLIVALERLEDRRARRALDFLFLRALQRAVYTPQNIGHYGLGATHYLHFTSPIRRYPDLAVHRRLKNHWRDAGKVHDEKALARLGDALARIAHQSSERERAALEAERESDAYFAALYMEPRIGQTFAGTVTAVTEFGAFVRLDDHHVEGLVRAETIAPRWSFDELRHKLSFGKGREPLGLASEVEVVCVGVRVDERKIDLQLADTVGAAPVGRRGRQAAFDDSLREAKARRGGRSKKKTGGSPAPSGRKKKARPGKKERAAKQKPSKKRR
ncbi:MAG: ribonuclease R [Deltaproteobacteria bacterium]|nr:ribonuclease R [Deltaproteobacteria bacterium]